MVDGVNENGNPCLIAHEKHGFVEKIIGHCPKCHAEVVEEVDVHISKLPPAPKVDLPPLEEVPRGMYPGTEAIQQMAMTKHPRGGR